MSELIKKSYFYEMPLYNEELLLYVIVLNAPYIEDAKKERYKLFLSKRTLSEFKDYIRDYYFPYTDADVKKMNGSGVIIIKMESMELAKKVAEALNGVRLDKEHEAIALTYSEFDKISQLSDNYVEKKTLEFENANQWEKSNFTEMLLIESKDKITVGTVHFLKKTFNVNYTLPNSKDINEISWSPQGKYLVISKEDKIILYGGENDQPITELKFHSHNYKISNDENYIVTFSGYQNDKPVKETKPEAKEDDEEDEEGEEEEDEDKKKKKEDIDNVFVRDILNNQILRSFVINKEEKFSNFIWSPDSKYLGRIQKQLLIVYELPSMKMVLDKKENLRMPIKDGVKQFSWFPNNNILITISEKYDANKKDKLLSSTLDFIELPSKDSFPSSSLANSEIIDLVWHKNNKLLAILSKECNQNKYSVRLIDFNIQNKNYSSSNCKLPVGTAKRPLIDMKICWMGDILFVVPKYKEINVESISVYPYNLNKQSLVLEPWPAENSYDNLKHSHFVPSSNGLNFLLACMDKNNTNNYGKCDLYVLNGGKMSFCKPSDMGAGLSKLEWDHDGRLCIVELNYGKEKEGFRIINCLGDSVFEDKDLKLISVSWRPRHKFLLNQYEEEKKIEADLVKISKVYEDEDGEFLSSHEKKQRAIDKEIYDKFTSVMKRRVEKYNKDKNRKEKKEEKKVNHDFWIEEILKGEEFIVDSQEY
jgi:WD40 repeat protein